LRLFVTGLGGYLGHAIAAAAAPDHEIAGTIRSTPAPPGTRAFGVDVRDEAAVGAALDDARPDAVIHTAYVQGGGDERSVNVDGAARSPGPPRRAACAWCTSRATSSSPATSVAPCARRTRRRR
jgi:dTDP-4-dehydrorhamnose reductase